LGDRVCGWNLRYIGTPQFEEEIPLRQLLNPGDAFPDLTLTSSAAESISVPASGPNYQVILFFRGKF
jgi:hypothetical protein